MAKVKTPKEKKSAKLFVQQGREVKEPVIELPAAIKYKTYKGYFNYYIMTEAPKIRKLKSHNFKRFTKRQVNALRTRFQGPAYKFVGEMVVRDRDKEI